MSVTSDELLDAEVAKEVLGLSVVEGCDGPMLGPWVEETWPTRRMVASALPGFSTNMGDAWSVVEHFVAQGFSAGCSAAARGLCAHPTEVK